jgi:hypothetical protein
MIPGSFRLCPAHASDVPGTLDDPRRLKTRSAATHQAALTRLEPRRQRRGRLLIASGATTLEAVLLVLKAIDAGLGP